MANVLKKLKVAGNPLVNFHLWDDLHQYELAETDEELASLHQKLLTKYEDRPLVCSFIYAMITYSTGVSINPQQLIDCSK